MNILNNWLKLSFPVIFLSLITGCNEGEQSQKDTPQSEVAIEVYDGLLSLKPNTKDYVSLEPYITSGSSTHTELSNVILLTTEDDDCSEALIEDDSLGFFTQVNGSAMCEYEYTVDANSAIYSSVGSSRAGIITIVASTSSNPTLTSIPYAVTLTGSAVAIKIDKELADIGETYPTDYILSDEYSLLGDGSVSINSSLRTISYTPLNTGPQRIVYRLLDPVGEDNYFGFIEIAVSDGLNQAPIAQDDAVYPKMIQKGVDELIDISGFVDSIDGDDFQLVKVDSFNASVTPTFPNDLLNKKFTFNALTTGEHYVSFVVSDHKGGFDTGLLKLTVEDPGQRSQWDGFFVGTTYYTGPLTLSESIDAGLDTTFQFDSGYNPAISIATFSSAKAQDYCASIGGSVPSSAAFYSLYDAHFDKGLSNWPLKYAYWENNGSNARLFNLATGTEQATVDFSRDYYLTCEISGSLTVSKTDNNALANGADEVLVEVMFKNGGDPVRGAELELTIEGDLKDFLAVNGNTVVTNNDGIARFTATSSRAGEATFTITHYSLPESESERFGASVVQKIAFVGDESTARFDSFNVVENGAVADDIETNKVRAILSDANKNPLSGLLIVFTPESSSISMVESPSILRTNEYGLVEASFISNEAGTFKVTAEFGELSQTLYMEFAAMFDVWTIDTMSYSRPLLLSEADQLNISHAGPYRIDDNESTPLYPGTVWANMKSDLVWDDVLDDFANTYCDELSDHEWGGFKDWRLPTTPELFTLNNYFTPNPAVSSSRLSASLGWPEYYYFSTTPDTSYPDVYKVGRVLLDEDNKVTGVGTSGAYGMIICVREE